MAQYDLDYLKKQITIENIYSLLEDLGAEPKIQKEIIVSKTICHHPLYDLAQAGHKLYYYPNSSLFHCYSGCAISSFDIFELIIKVKEQMGQTWTLPQAVDFIIQKFHLINQVDNSEDSFDKSLEDWKILNRMGPKVKEEKKAELKIYDDKILRFLPQPRILSWEKEGITNEVIKSRNIKYDPSCEGIVIPHYNINGELVGIRERTLIKENEQFGKYRPAILNGTQYNHPLGFNLYNLNYSKENIKALKKAIIVEGEKSCLLYASYFGIENDITCAVCGSSLLAYQVSLLASLGAEELIIGFDKQFQNIGDEEWKKWTKKLREIHDKYGSLFQISYLFDKENLLKYKDSPFDEGPDIFLQLFKERIIL